MEEKKPSPLGLRDADVAPLAMSQFVGSRRESAVRGEASLDLTVIVPARNEEAVLGACLESLLAQDEPVAFSLGREWELIVVDDASTDRTRAIADEAAGGRVGVMVLSAPEFDPQEWTGKANACWAAAEKARGRWLLFTDADTLQEAGSMVHGLHEAEKHGAALLSYSPRQIVSGLAQRVLMPLVFSELATVYPSAEVNDPGKPLAAANGQYLLIEREAYFAVEGHRGVRRSVLEDVDLAFAVKQTKRGIRFRYGPDALATRMYRGVEDMVEGWTKNLALLFPHALLLAAWRTLDIALLLLPLVLLVRPNFVLWQKAAIVLLWVRTLLRFYRRVGRSNFPLLDCALAPLGLPLFVGLILRSWMRHRVFRQVSWKGREYRVGR